MMLDLKVDDSGKLVVLCPDCKKARNLKLDELQRESEVNHSVQHSSLSIRAANSLLMAGLKSSQEVKMYIDKHRWGLSGIKGVGPKSEKEILHWLHSLYD